MNGNVNLSPQAVERAFQTGLSILSPESDLPIKMKDAENLLILRTILAAVLSGQLALTSAPKNTQGPVPPEGQPEGQPEVPVDPAAPAPTPVAKAVKKATRAGK